MGTLLYFTYQPIFRMFDFDYGAGHVSIRGRIFPKTVLFRYETYPLAKKSQPLRIIKIRQKSFYIPEPT